jgi:hypothetical protein
VPDEPDDTELEERLREVSARLDPVPPRLLRAAADSYTWRTIDSDLAELVFDSLADDHVAVTRGREHARLLTFEVSGLTVDIQVTGSGQGRRIVGQLTPPQRLAVVIRQDAHVTGLDADELGRFSGPLHDGPFSLLCGAGAERDRPVVTDWISL